MDRQIHHGNGKKLVATVTTTCMDRGEPVLLIGTYKKLVASSVGVQQCSPSENKIIYGP